MIGIAPCTKARIKRALTSDEMGLLILGVLGLARGISYFPPMVDPHRPPAHALEHIFNPPVWGALWALAGIGCLVAILWRRPQPLAVGAVVGMHFIWAVSFLAGDGRGWVSALSYLCVFALAFWAFARGRREPELVPLEPPKLE